MLRALLARLRRRRLDDQVRVRLPHLLREAEAIVREAANR